MAKQWGKAVLVPCTISGGAFASERTFRLKSVGATGVAQAEYCYGADKKPLVGRDIATDESIDGYVAGITIGQGEVSGLVRVNLPDGEIYDLREDQLVQAKDFANVPVEP